MEGCAGKTVHRGSGMSSGRRPEFIQGVENELNFAKITFPTFSVNRSSLSLKLAEILTIFDFALFPSEWYRTKWPISYMHFMTCQINLNHIKRPLMTSSPHQLVTPPPLLTLASNKDLNMGLIVKMYSLAIVQAMYHNCRCNLEQIATEMK